MNSSGYVVGWGTLSLLNAGLAQGKGRSGLGWWLLSLLLGPVATLLIVLLPELRRATPEPTLRPSRVPGSAAPSPLAKLLTSSEPRSRSASDGVGYPFTSALEGRIATTPVPSTAPHAQSRL